MPWRSASVASGPITRASAADSRRFQRPAHGALGEPPVGADSLHIDLAARWHGGGARRTEVRDQVQARAAAKPPGDAQQLALQREMPAARTREARHDVLSTQREQRRDARNALATGRRLS